MEVPKPQYPEGTGRIRFGATVTMNGQHLVWPHIEQADAFCAYDFVKVSEDVFETVQGSVDAWKYRHDTLFVNRRDIVWTHRPFGE